MTLYPKLITDALATVMYAGTKKNIIESGMLADDVRIDGMKVTITLLFPKETDPFLKLSPPLLYKPYATPKALLGVYPLVDS